jgi:hypothetical protein
MLNSFFRWTFSATAMHHASYELAGLIEAAHCTARPTMLLQLLFQLICTKIS